MSNTNKLNWLAVVTVGVYLVLVSMIILLVVLNGARDAENGLQCVYNCGSYNKVLEGLK